MRELEVQLANLQRDVENLKRMQVNTVIRPAMPNGVGTGGGSSGPNVGDVAVCALTQTGGSAGTKSAYCSYTYTFKDITGTTTHGTGASPIASTRKLRGAMTAATYGLEYWNGSAWVLLEAYEYPAGWKVC